MFYGVMFDELGIRLFGYISFRVAMAALTGFALAVWWGRPTIAWLKRRRVQENVAKSDSAELARAAAEAGKDTTPTMGGSFLILALVASVILWARLDVVHVVLGLILIVGLAAVGFVDDYKKLTIPGCKGLSRGAKMIGLSAVTLGVRGAVAWYAHSSGRWTLLALHPPFFKDTQSSLGTWQTWGLVGIGLFLAFEWFVVVGTANAVNITDGMDGLAAGCLIISGGAPGDLLLRHRAHRLDRVPGAALRATRLGDGGPGRAPWAAPALGFLWYNAYPAQVFMGDSGSLPLGGALAWMARVSKQELVLPLIASVFVADLATSGLQTLWYRHSGGQRLFTLAPIHHGLERYGGVFRRRETGWHEVQVVVRFWIVAAMGALASLALLKVR